MGEAHLKVYRGNADGGELVDYHVPVEAGMVVLDALHYIQGNQDPDLAVRWNCKAAKCGSCSAEVNGKPCLTCKTRLDDFPEGEPIEVRPMKTFPVIKDLVTDVSWNFEVKKLIPPFQPATKNTDSWRIYQEDVDRIQEFRKCIECFLCQNVCHVLRNHDKKDLKDKRNLFAGPRFIMRTAELEMHPLDTENRLAFAKNDAGIGYCNITKCCSEVCPEDIHITDNAIISLKERVVDYYYDPLMILWRKLTGKK